MTVKALPGSAVEVIKTEFFFKLLVSLLANPSRAPPSAECSCDRQGRSAPIRRAGTFDAEPYDPIQSRNGLSQRLSSSFQSDVLPTMVGPSNRPP